MLSRIALPRIGAVLADRKGTITNDLAAAEELKQKAVEAEKAYNEALATARAEAAKIVAAAKAEIQKDLDAATAKADAEIAAKAAESEKSHRRDPRRRCSMRWPKWPRTRPRNWWRLLGGTADAQGCDRGRHRPAERVRR